jgi:hypothetical protein
VPKAHNANEDGSPPAPAIVAEAKELVEINPTKYGVEVS